MKSSIRQFGNGLLGFDFGLGVGRERIQRIALVEIELLAGSIDRATGREQIARDAGLLGELSDPNRSIAIDRVGRGGVHFAHRVVGERRQMHDAIVTSEIVERDIANILAQIAIGRNDLFPTAIVE